MKVHLMFKNKDFISENRQYYDFIPEETGLNSILLSDLEINKIIDIMSDGDDLIKSVCKSVFLSPLNNIDEIKYRQEIQKDIIKYPDIIKKIYKICHDTAEKQRYSRYSLTSEWLSSTFASSVGLIKLYSEQFCEIKKIADKNISCLKSEGLCNLLKMIQENFTEKYLSKADKLLNQLNEVDGTLISAKFGSNLQGISYTYRQNRSCKLASSWHFAPSYTLPERDNVSAEDLTFRKDRAINRTTNILAKTAEHFENFFVNLKNELAFYMGCINLYEKIKDIGMPLSVPELLPSSCNKRHWKQLYDTGLALFKKSKITGNDYESYNKNLYIITGANQGGKTTFLRSLGQAQLMSQCGMLVNAELFTAPVRNRIFSHFKKEEDNNMNSGKLDEEMYRMNQIVSEIKSGDMILSNESFSSTNEKEGSEIFTQITKALIENDIEIFSVTHMYSYSLSFMNNSQTEYLKAEHLEDGKLTFKIIKGKPMETAFGEEIYKKIFEKN